MPTPKPKAQSRPFCFSVKGQVKMLRLVRVGARARDGDGVGAGSQRAHARGDRAAKRKVDALSSFPTLFLLRPPQRQGGVLCTPRGWGTGM